MRNLLIFILIILTIIISSITFAQDSGVLMSGGPSAGALISAPKMQLKINPINQRSNFVQDEVYFAFEEKVKEVLQKAITSQNIGLNPELASYALGQIVIQATRNEAILNIIAEAYQNCLNQYKQLKDKRVPLSVINKDIKAQADAIIHPIVNETIFRAIIEDTLKNVIVKQQQIMMQTEDSRREQIELLTQGQYKTINEQYKQGLE
ncbi:MAG: hypothetical protein P9X22_04760 [Candidatus Zapsychrus exili]|nr:hypothetical protein [Candidatus Zapsychrus exili]